jgi:hypothetical protein
MGLLDLFRRKPSAEPTRLGNEQELKAFVLAATGDEPLADLLVEVTLHVGCEGYLEIAQGGPGQPYSVDYTPCPDDGRKQSEVQAECRALERRIELATSDSERDQFQRELARMGGGSCTIHVNTFSAADFEKRRALIRKVWTRCQGMWARDERF